MDERDCSISLKIYERDCDEPIFESCIIDEQRESDRFRALLMRDICDEK